MVSGLRWRGGGQSVGRGQADHDQGKTESWRGGVAKRMANNDCRTESKVPARISVTRYPAAESEPDKYCPFSKKQISKGAMVSEIDTISCPIAGREENVREIRHLERAGHLARCAAAAAGGRTHWDQQNRKQALSPPLCSFVSSCVCDSLEV
ncbi:unnamed protein product [Boreogadus saida]